MPGARTSLGRPYYATSDGLRAHFDACRRLWVYELLDASANQYIETGTTRGFRPYF